MYLADYIKLVTYENFLLNRLQVDFKMSNKMNVALLYMMEIIYLL